MEWWNADRASTSPSISVTVRQAGMPAPSIVTIREAAEPWT
jgi:hypothetical protein